MAAFSWPHFAQHPALSKGFIAFIAIVAGGVVLGSIDISNPEIDVDYSISSEKLPAKYHGTNLMITEIKVNDASKIIDYGCSIDKIIFHSLNYTFYCWAEDEHGNRSNIPISIYIREPTPIISSDCLESYFVTLDDVLSDPKFFNLSSYGPSYQQTLKSEQVLLMDTSFDHGDLLLAKKHATIVLKIFDINDIQALSTMANIVRDEDRTDISRSNCAISVHSEPRMLLSPWGKISLAEDYYVLGEFKTSAFWVSEVIDNYGVNSNIEETHYQNSLLIKGNALYRDALLTDRLFDNSKTNYTVAHEISPSYTSWFGLGNIDRQEDNLSEAITKYYHAKSFDFYNFEINEILILTLLNNENKMEAVNEFTTILENNSEIAIKLLDTIPEIWGYLSEDDQRYISMKKIQLLESVE